MVRSRIFIYSPPISSRQKYGRRDSETREKSKLRGRPRYLVMGLEIDGQELSAGKAQPFFTWEFVESRLRVVATADFYLVRSSLFSLSLSFVGCLSAFSEVIYPILVSLTLDSDGSFVFFDFFVFLFEKL